MHIGKKQGFIHNLVLCFFSYILFGWILLPLSTALAADVITVGNTTGEETGLSADGVGSLGTVPGRIDLSFPDQAQTQRNLLTSSNLPASYDLRAQNKLTAVRDQGNYGTCWAFGALGSLESCLLPGETEDFSENHMFNYRGYNQAYSSEEGGDIWTAMAYLTRWGGPVYEGEDPYYVSSLTSSPSGLVPRKHVQKVILLPNRISWDDNDKIKTAVMNYGAVCSDLYWVNACYRQVSGSIYAYYNNQAGNSNHMIDIVGWDDNYPNSNFSPSAPYNGAFLCRNSWGPAWGDGGYFWASYCDKNLASSNNNSIFCDAEPVSNYQYIYQYDPLGMISQHGYSDTTAWAANIFTAQSDQQVAAVSTYIIGSGIVDVYIYRDVTNSPTGGTQESHQSMSVDNSGYYTITLDTPALVAAGEKFSAVVKYNLSNNRAPIPTEDDTLAYFDATANSGESYISHYGTSWKDITTAFPNSNVCIKAFANDSVKPPAVEDYGVMAMDSDYSCALLHVYNDPIPAGLSSLEVVAADAGIPGADPSSKYTLDLSTPQAANSDNVLTRVGSATLQPGCTIYYRYVTATGKSAWVADGKIPEEPTGTASFSATGGNMVAGCLNSTNTGFNVPFNITSAFGGQARLFNNNAMLAHDVTVPVSTGNNFYVLSTAHPEDFSTDGQQSLEVKFINVDGHAGVGGLTTVFTRDTSTPQVLSSLIKIDNTHVKVLFNKVVTSGCGVSGAANPGNYSLSIAGLADIIPLEAVLDDTGTYVILQTPDTEGLDPGQTIAATVLNITDVAGNPMDASFNRAVYTQDVFPSATALLGLSITGAGKELIQNFDAFTLNYALQVRLTTQAVKVTANPAANTTARIYQDTVEVSDGDISLCEGRNTIRVVIQEAGKIDTVYNIIITRPIVDECFIATACFGSKFEPHVVLLRQFRNKYLLTNKWGGDFVSFYYRHSPPIAAYIAQNELLKEVVRILLVPVIVLAYWAFHPEYGASMALLLVLIILYKRRMRAMRL